MLPGLLRIRSVEEALKTLLDSLGVLAVCSWLFRLPSRLTPASCLSSQ